MTTIDDDVLAETIGALGEELSVLAGLRVTRLTAPWPKGSATAPVESTLDWPASGKALVDGVEYSYSGKTLVTLTGITYEDGGVQVGAKQDHEFATVVVDFSKTFSKIDQAIGQLFVRTATGTELSIVGQNVGVDRPPGLVDDDVFRGVIEALAYLPRGTFQGLEIALTAFFGAGNFRLWENIPTFRNTVFIEITGGLYFVPGSQGKTFLTRQEPSLLDTGTKQLTLAVSPMQVEGVRLADENHTTSFATQKPSVETEVRYDGDAGIPIWTFAGSSEILNVVVLTADDGVVAITDPSALGTTSYFHTARIRPESEAYFELGLDASVVNGTGMAFTMNLRDGARDIAVGFKRVDGTHYEVGFCSPLGDSFISGSVGPFLTTGANYLAFAIRKVGSRVQLLIDNTVVQELLTSDFDVSTKNEQRFGCQNTAGGTTSSAFRVKYASFFVHTSTDYWNLHGVAGATIGPTTFDTNSGAVVIGDVGKAFRVYDAPSPENNGTFRVLTAPTSDNVTLTGRPRYLAILESVHPARVRIANDNRAFKYPDDIGKKIDLSSALTAPNPGTYVIAAVLSPVDFSAFSGIDEEFSNIVEVSGSPGFVTETEIPWKLLPDFVNEAGISWELADAGSVAGAVLTLRANPPLDIPVGYEVILETVYSEVLSGQLLAGHEVDNDPAGAFFPFYLPPNPLGPFRSFIDNLTVAGVIPEIKL